eukprot:70157-Pleurochrysis_carterae.AAC.2
MVKVDVAACADVFHQEIKKGVQECISSGWGRPKLVGFLANNDSGAAMYARWTGKACERDGVDFELRHVERTKLEEAVVEANDDNSVHGIIVYYPVFGGPIDDYIRDVISIKKAQLPLPRNGLNHSSHIAQLIRPRQPRSLIPSQPMYQFFHSFHAIPALLTSTATLVASRKLPAPDFPLTLVFQDVEGLNHRYRYSLYHNIRTLDNFGNRKYESAWGSTTEA